MIFNPRSKLQKKIGLPAEIWVFLQKNALSCRKMPFPARKCTFLQKNVLFGGHMAGNRRKLQEGFRAQESRTLAKPTSTRERVVFQKGGFGGCSLRTKTGTRVHSDVPPERKPERGYVRMFPRKKKPERGYIRQNHPFTKPPFYLPVKG